MESSWILLVCVVSFARADYPCICNYNVELSVYEAMSNTSKNIGYMYEFDCKERLLTTHVNPGWGAVAYEHKVGFVHMSASDASVETQECQGTPPASDIVIPTTLPQSTMPPTPPTISKTTLLPTLTTSIQPKTTIHPTTPMPTTKPLTTTQSTTPVPTTQPPKTTVPTTQPPTTTQSTTPVPTTQPPKTTVPTTQPPTTTRSTTTPSPTTQSTIHHGIVSGRTELCPAAVRSYTARDGGTLGQYDTSCYEIVPHQHSWQYAEKDCSKKGGHLAHISNAGEQQFLYNFLHKYNNHYTWIGLHDLNTEGHYEWVSGNAVNYTKWLPGKSTAFHSIEDCVYLNPHNGGYWNDDECGTGFLSFTRIPYVCQYAINPSTTVTGTVNPHGNGDTHLCPSSVQHHASKYHGNLAQYGQNCYEFLSRYKVTWSHGETLCRQEGGHLAHINNADEQNFIQSFMVVHSPHHAVWIGLNDRANETHFTWTSGNTVTYTNWVNGHSGTANHLTADCTLLIPYQQGHWDDVPCGQHLAFFGDVGETHPVLCQFPTTKGSASVIVG